MYYLIKIFAYLSVLLFSLFNLIFMRNADPTESPATLEVQFLQFVKGEFKVPKELKELIDSNDVINFKKSLETIEDLEVFSDSLFYAINVGKIEFVKAVWEKCHYIYLARNDFHQTALMYSLAAKQHDISVFLIDKTEKNLHATDPEKNTALHYAITFKDLEVTKKILDKDIKRKVINCRNRSGHTAYEVACAIKERNITNDKVPTEDYNNARRLLALLANKDCSTLNKAEEDKIIDKKDQTAPKAAGYVGAITGTLGLLAVCVDASTKAELGAACAPVVCNPMTGIPLAAAGVAACGGLVSKKIYDNHQEEIIKGTRKLELKQKKCYVM